MSNKQAVIELVNRLQESASLREIAHEIEFLAAIQEGETQADRGEVVPHDEVKREFATWIAR
jgi:predicted transcriptional regulator